MEITENNGRPAHPGLANLKPFTGPDDPRRCTSGRRPTRMLTKALFAELRRKPFKHSAVTNSQLVAAMLVTMAVRGNVSATKLILAYTEGLPVQPVTIDIHAEAEQLASRFNVPADRVLAVYERLRQAG